jgi:hypothetical protein
MTKDSSFEYRTDREDRENPTETCHKKPEMRNVCWNRDDIIERKLYDIFSVPADPSPAPGFLPSVSSRVGNNVLDGKLLRTRLGQKLLRTRLGEKLLTHAAQSRQ